MGKARRAMSLLLWVSQNNAHIGLACSHLSLQLRRFGAAGWRLDKSFASLPGDSSELLKNDWNFCELIEIMR